MKSPHRSANRHLPTLLGALLLAAALPALAQPPAPEPTEPPSPPASTPAASPSAPAATPPGATTAQSAAPGQPAFQPDNRIIASGDWETLNTSGAHTGSGGSLGYLGQPSASTLIGIAGEYQTLAGVHWEFGSLSGSYSHALTRTTLWDISAEVHEGIGQAGSMHFVYGIEAFGGGLSLPSEVSLSAEDRQIDVDTSHGSLPRLGVSKGWGQHWLTSIAYADSVTGNLNTDYGLARVDFLSAPIRLLAGASFGHVSPAVLDIEGIQRPQAQQLREYFVGVTRPSRLVDISLLGDRIDLATLRRYTVTLTATLHLR
jgi:hypothetical protein